MARTLVVIALAGVVGACSLQVLPVPTGPIAGGPSSSSGGSAGSGSSSGVSGIDSGGSADATGSEAAAD